MKVKVDANNLPAGKTDWKQLDAMTDAEIEAAARADPDNPPLTDEELNGMRLVSPVKSVRHRLGMTQEEFAGAFQISLATVRDWEQGRCQPDQSARALFRLIAAIPDAVKSALKNAPAGL